MTEAEFAAQGWQRLPVSGFSLSIGQTWMKGEAGSRTVALFAQDRIVNDYGAVVHGGALMTFADVALGTGAADAITGHSYVTVQLQYAFAGGAPAGALLTCAPELVRKTASLAFMRGLIAADGKVIGSADGIFKALGPR